MPSTPQPAGRRRRRRRRVGGTARRARRSRRRSRAGSSTHCTAAGGGSAAIAARTVRGSATPVMPHAPMRPSATSASNAGRTSSTNRVHGVCELGRDLGVTRRHVAVGHEVGVQPEDVDPIEAHRGERAGAATRRSARPPGPSGSPSITLVPIRTPAGSRRRTPRRSPARPRPARTPARRRAA